MENRSKKKDESNWKKLSEATYLIYLVMLATRFFPTRRILKQRNQIDNFFASFLDTTLIVGLLFIIVINLIHLNDPNYFEKKAK